MHKSRPEYNINNYGQENTYGCAAVWLHQT